MRLGNKDIREKSVPPSLAISCPFDIFHIIEHRCRIRHPMIGVLRFTHVRHVALVFRNIRANISIMGEIISIVLANRS